MITAIYSWMLIALLFLMLEMGNPGLFFFLSFFFGSIAATFASYYDLDLTVQLLSFFGVTLLALGILRLFLKKFHSPIYKTNVEALLGKQGIVTKAIESEEPGYVKVEGQIWLARSLDKQIVPVGQVVLIVGFKGSHLLVKEYNIKL